jgi:transcriptional regulator with XRE-family HTH domain
VFPEEVTVHQMASHFIFLASAGQAEGRAPVKKTSRYGERDYAFGQAMLTLRTSIGLTQAVLADLLQVSRRAVAEWEAGSSYPKAGNLKQIIALEVQQQAFASGREVEEIHALWKAARQKVLLNESWLHELLAQQRPPLPLAVSLTGEETGCGGAKTTSGTSTMIGA